MNKRIPAFKRFFKAGYNEYFPWPERMLLCLAVLIAYASVWPDTFVFDDTNLIVLNTFLKHWSGLPKLLTSLNFGGGGLPGGFYRPVPMAAYFFVYQAFGPSSVAFHALNVSLQALNACLLHHFGIRAGFKKGVAFAAALLWAVHPLHTINVAYMASTAELLWSSFCLLGLITLLPDFTSRKIWQAMIFFLLALGCKESAIVFPALAAITFFFVSNYRARVSAYLKMWPLWLLAAGYFATQMVFMHKTGYTMDLSGDPIWFQDYTSNFTNRVLTSFATLPVYARLIVWPTGLHTARNFPIFSTLQAWPPAAGALVIGLSFLHILWGQARRGLALSFGLLWFAVALSPYTGIAIPIDALISEGWLYLPTMGLFLAVMQTAARFFEKKENVARLLVLVLAFALGITTFFQNEVWRNNETLYQNILQNGGDTSQLRSFLGVFYLEQQEFDKASEQFQYEVNHLNKRDTPQWAAETHINLAMALLHVSSDEGYNVTIDEVDRGLSSSPHIPEAIRELGQAILVYPDCYFAHVVLSAVYRHQGNDQMADFHRKQAESILQKQANPSP